MSITTYVLGLVGAAMVLGLVVELLRRRHLRGKYAVLWLALAVLIAIVAVVPDSLGTLADLLGVQTPTNLLFFAANIVMLLVIMQLSYESGRLEEKTRTLAEEVGLLRLDVQRLQRERDEHLG
ncbi:MAG: DUF2304 domain-containing protein [Frankiales bacterium]|nr:DUF2304 domain-containing protein [Frankiales bacterium]